MSGLKESDHQAHIESNQDELVQKLTMKTCQHLWQLLSFITNGQ